MPPAGWGADRAKLQDCILVVLLQTLAAASVEYTVYRKVWSSFLPHLPHYSAGGRGVARPGRVWR